MKCKEGSYIYITMNLRNLVKGHVYKNDPSIKCKEGTYMYINEPRAYKELHTFHVTF